MVRSENDRGLSEAESTWRVILAGPQKRVVTAIIGRPFGHVSTGNEGKSKEGAKVIPEALYKPKGHSRKAPGETWEAGTHSLCCLSEKDENTPRVRISSYLSKELLV